MKKLKLFSLALMALFATNLWAADPDIAFEIPVSGATKADYFKGWNIGTSVVTLSATMDLSSNDSHQNISITSNAGNLNANYISIKVTTGSETIDSIAVYAGGSGNNKGIKAPVIGWTTGYAEQETTANSLDYFEFTSASSGGGKIDNADWYLVDLSGDNIKEARIYKKLSKNQVQIEGETTSVDLGSGETIRIWGMKIWLKAATPSITAFSVAGVDATIDQDLKTITAMVPNDTEGWPNLTPSVTIGGSATGYTPSGAQDFSAGAINYTVTDGTNNVTYAVTITRAEACENPVITTDLSTGEVKYIQNTTASALSIEATGKNLTYQWYSNTTNSTEGATSLGTSAQTESYTPSTADLGTVYYFCVVSSGICTTTSAITPITIKMPRTTGWVIYDGMTDESFTSGSIEYNSVTVNYTVVGNSMLSAGDVEKRNKDNQFNDYTYPNAVRIEKHNPEAETPVNAYVSFTIPTNYQATKIILAVAYAGGSRNVVLATSAVTAVDADDVIASLHTGGNSEKIFDATYTPASALAAGTYYILTPVGGSWNIFHLQLLIEPASATSLDNTEDAVKAVKVLRDGQIFIEKNGHVYNVFGACIK